MPFFKKKQARIAPTPATTKGITLESKREAPIMSTPEVAVMGVLEEGMVQRGV